jgi:hypothetical protein
MGAQSARIEPQRRHAFEAPSQRLRARFVHHDPSFAIEDRLTRPTTCQRNHWPAARLRLERDNPEIFFARQNNGQRRAVFISQGLVRHVTQELDPRAGTSLEPGKIGTCSRDP